tara:strand:- start:30 stop:971 length:942 start_codon:yes stop_codon:yes gene_type:complete
MKLEEPFFKINDKVKIEVVLFNSILNIMSFNFQIFKILKKNLSDYYVSLDSNTVFLQSIFLPKKTHLILWEHFSLSENYNKLFFRLSRYYASKRAYKFVLLSRNEVNSWKSIYKIPDKKLRHIYNPITIENVEEVSSENLYMNKKVIAIGNNIYVKGFDLLLESWSLLDRNGWSLEVVGLPENELKKLEILKDNYSFRNKVVLTGRVSNIKDKYLDSSIYCLCSRKEATPLVLIESQYVGLPAISFDNCEGPLELLNNSGLVVEFGDVNKYSNTISKLISSKGVYLELSKRAKDNSQRFNNKTFYEKWCKVLN